MPLKAKTSRDLNPQKRDVAVRDGGKCVYCGLDGSQDIRILRNLHLDHLIPKSANGSWDHENLVLSCYQCNRDKGYYDPSEGVDLKEWSINASATREQLIKKALDFIVDRRGHYYSELYALINSK